MILQYGLGSVSNPVELQAVYDDINNIIPLPLTFWSRPVSIFGLFTLSDLYNSLVNLTIPHIPCSALPDTGSYGYVVAGASYKYVTTNACPARKLLTAQ
jgi:hypothetical protein